MMLPLVIGVPMTAVMLPMFMLLPLLSAVLPIPRIVVVFVVTRCHPVSAHIRRTRTVADVPDVARTQPDTNIRPPMLSRDLGEEQSHNRDRSWATRKIWAGSWSSVSRR